MSAQNQPTPSVDVTGEGTISVVPDQVTVNVRAENIGNSAKEVKLKNDLIINEVLKFVKGMGIKDTHIQTDYIRLAKNYQHNTKTYNYAANQSISIKLVDLANYETLMNGLLESGINRIDGVSFSSSERLALETEARKNAMTHARQKANEYAAVLGQSIGKALHISEFRNVSTPTPMYRSAMMMEASDGGQQTLAPGEMEIKVRVNVSFLLN